MGEAKEAVDKVVDVAMTETDKERADRAITRLRELVRQKAQQQQPQQQPQVRMSLGVRDGAVYLTVGTYTLPLSADQADELAADLRNFALELRNGGRLL